MLNLAWQYMYHWFATCDFMILVFSDPQEWSREADRPALQSGQVVWQLPWAEADLAGQHDCAAPQVWQLLGGCSVLHTHRWPGGWVPQDQEWVVWHFPTSGELLVACSCSVLQSVLRTACSSCLNTSVCTSFSTVPQNWAFECTSTSAVQYITVLSTICILQYWELFWLVLFNIIEH